MVDDEAYITDLLKCNLEAENYSITIVTKASLVMAMNLAPFRLAIIDAMEQKYNGLDLLRDLKANPLSQHIPVIILSHSDSQDDIVEAFDAGADDYVMKPFSLRELMARVRSVLRRHMPSANPMKPASTLKFRTLEVDLVSRQVREDGMLLPLTKTEYAILVFLLKHRNNFFNRASIYDEVWRDADRPASDRIVDTNISRLRKKLGPVSEGLVNKTGLGYAFID